MSDDAQKGRLLQRLTIAWNVVEVGITIGLGIVAGSLALVAFGLDSLIEVFASLVVLWHMAAPSGESSRDARARRLVGLAFAVLAVYLLVAGVRALWTGDEPDSSPVGIAYLSLTTVVMFGLSVSKKRIGLRLGSEPFLAEAHMTFLDGCLAAAIVLALALNALFGWWWADAGAALIVSVAAAREAWEMLGDAD